MKKLLSFGLCLLLLISMLPVCALAEDAPDGEKPNDTTGYGFVSGTFGGGFAWSLTESTGELVVTGSGDMPNDWVSGTDIPWYSYGLSIKSAFVGEGITSICKWAFVNCTNMTSVSLPTTLKSTDYMSFYNAGLTSLTLPDGMETIGDQSFCGCENLTTVNLNDGLKTIEEFAFSQCGLTGLSLPGSLESIGSEAFYLCENLKSVTVGKGIREIPCACFAGCFGLETLSLPSSILGLDYNAFYQCSHLQNLTVASDGTREFDCWTDKDNNRITNTDLKDGSARGVLVARWLRIWNEGRFTDVPAAAWYHGDVKFCFRHDLFFGLTDTLFGPKQSATRAQVVTVLYRMAGCPAVAGGSSFDDVPAGAYFTDAVAWAAANSIVLGSDDNNDGLYSFRPYDSITREDFLCLLYRYAKWAGGNMTGYEATDLSAFSDSGQIASWALAAEKWSVGTGLQTGSDGMLLPGTPITRAQVAAFLARYETNA